MPNNEKSIDSMTPAELRQALDEYTRAGRPAPPQQPDAPGCESLSPAARETARTLYGQSVMATPASQLTRDQKDFLRAGIAAWKQE